MALQSRNITLALLFGIQLIVAPNTATAQWGAEAVPDRLRPAQTWVSRFSDSPDIIANGSIEAAIEKCDSIVGVRRYCVVGVGADSSDRPFGIYRSRTRIVGLADAVTINAEKDTASVYIPTGLRYVVVENLTLAGIDADNSWTAAIEISGSNIRDVLIRNNVIRNFKSDMFANGIVVYGSGKNSADRISRVIIDGNLIHDMQTGYSESVAINGNVTQWIISGNRIERVNNIAIDAIGGEGIVDPVENSAGIIRPSSQDAARTGWIENNVVSDMSTVNNPAYGNQHTWAAAIYIDGGRRIKITGNEVYNAPWAYEIGAENCVISRDIIMLNNTAIGSYYGDLRLGGYAKGGYAVRNSSVNCNPLTSDDSEEGHGYVRELTIKDNFLGTAAPQVSNVFIEFRTERAIIVQDGVEPVLEDGNGWAPGDGNAIKVLDN